MNFRYVQWRQIKQKLSPFNSIFFHWSIAIFHQKFNNSHSLATFSLPMCGILEEMLLLLLLLLFIVIPANICLTILPLGKISLCTQCYINSEKKKDISAKSSEIKAQNARQARQRNEQQIGSPSHFMKKPLRNSY